MRPDPISFPFLSCGAWGALSVALYGLLPAGWALALSPPSTVVSPPEAILLKQLLGVAVCFVWVFLTSNALFWVIHYTTLLPTANDHTAGGPEREFAREDAVPPREYEPKESADCQNS